MYSDVHLAIPFSDVDECINFNGGCDHTCVNTIGTYRCECRDGWQLDDGQLKCIGMVQLIRLRIA